MGKLIEADSITKAAERAYYEWNLAMGAAENNRQVNKCYKMQELCKAVKAVAEAAPAVDAVPVIRCRDCEHFMRYSYTTGDCDIWKDETKCGDFCSYAEPVNKPVESVDK